MSDRLTAAQQGFLLRLARDTITAHLRGGKKPPAATDDPDLKGKRGAFVTLHIDGGLRGCIGYPLPYRPLVETISEMALAAATQDLRFESIREDELDHLRIEISALTLPRPIQDPAEVEVGRHGIIISRGGRQGLLLPQVPLEYGWDRETYLRHGCLKAGLPDDAWKKGAAIQVFEAQVFSEPE
jgi:AmmeMemoRadiSam system protein A